MPRLHPNGTSLYFGVGSSSEYARVKSVNWPPIRDQLQANFAPILLVADRSLNEITAVDLALGKVVRHLPVVDGPFLLSNNSPQNVILHPERDLAYVSLPRENAVAEIDLVTAAVVRRIPVGIEPDGLRWSLD